jgi:tetratricopeptide (TPR) repeat protein
MNHIDLKRFLVLLYERYFWRLGIEIQMKNLLTNISSSNEVFTGKIYSFRAEKLIREASESFIYFRDYEMALQKVEEAIRLDFDNVKALILKGNIFSSIEENSIALQCYDRALSIDPFSAEAYTSKANILDTEGSLEEALKCCCNAFNYSSKKDHLLLTSLYDQKISILIKMKKYEEAKFTLKESYKTLKEEDSSYIASCYRDIIENFQKEKKRKKRTAKKRFKLIHSA